MATYKLEVTKKFGKFAYKFYQAGEQAEEVTDLTSIDEVIRAVEARYGELELGPDSDVIFRGIAYNTVKQLKTTVRSAPF